MTEAALIGSIFALMVTSGVVPAATRLEANQLL